MEQSSSLEAYREANAALRECQSRLAAFRKIHFLLLDGAMFFCAHSAVEGAAARRKYGEMVREKARLESRRDQALSAWAATREFAKGENYGSRSSRI